MNVASRLALGTVQFGLAYGVTNQAGCPDDAAVSAILARAAAAGLRTLDTAHAYGDAETRLGRLLPAIRPDWRVISKSPPLAGAAVGAGELRRVEAALADSLARLGRARLDGLLVHHAGDLLAPGGKALWCLLERARAAGRIGKIGVSVYGPEEAARCLDAFPLDLIQLPFSLYDQRAARGGLLAALAAAGVEVHARSLFLQGALLAAPAALPPALARLRSHQAALHAALAAAGLTPLQASLAAVLAHPAIAQAVVGCQSPDQFDAILAAGAVAAETDPATIADLAGRFALDDDDLLTPSRWQP